MKNSSDNVFGPISVGPGETALVEGYLGDQDFAADAGGDAEEGGCLWDCLGISAGIEVVINGALGSLVEF